MVVVSLVAALLILAVLTVWAILEGDTFAAFLFGLAIIPVGYLAFMWLGGGVANLHKFILLFTKYILVLALILLAARAFVCHRNRKT